MSKTFEQGKDEIARLCKYFAANRDSFLAPGVKEAHVRLHLIDPMFECLGWDVRNTAMIAPQYREVVTEDSLEIEGTQKAPDYSFRVGTLSKYFGEAKKCGININADPLPAYQLRRYGWSARVPLSILTDFEEFGVYDCSTRPKPADKAGFGRLNYFRFDEYPDRWRELWDIFSRQAVWEGAFDKYAASRRKRGTTEVDGEFLKEIEGWRDALAHNIALRNRFLAPDDLNSAVQRTIDRVIFLRMAEDRGSEPYGQLLKLCEQPDIYKRFIGKLCRSADEKYNSGLFHFQKEEGVADSPDFISAKLQVDDKVFKPILQSLYFEHGSPYHFGVLPVELLGTVYERFLGKVIRLTAEHRAKVEEKPEVRKAGGVYYTPAYIVDYIVKNTVGKMIEGKSPAQLAKFREGQPLRVLDMACGSGSFLLGAFQCLLDHSLRWYTENNPEKFKKEVYKTTKDEWRLAIAEKKRLLTTHIFGVDIDPQAVEVSKLSLLLKVMEGETDETVGQSRMLFHERALPNLANNIKCGNSLIGPDYFSGRLIPDPDELKRVNPFDWNREFPDAMKSGGFDCVIGNPPYGAMFSELEKAYLFKNYPSLKGQPESYEYFLHLFVSLTKKCGKTSLIVPTNFIESERAEGLRITLLASGQIKLLSSFRYNVWKNNAAETLVLVFQKGISDRDQVKIIHPKSEEDFIHESNFKEINQSEWWNTPKKRFIIRATPRVVKKIESKAIQLHTVCDISQGIIVYKTRKDSALNLYISEEPKRGWKKLLDTKSSIQRYNLVWGKRYLNYGEWLWCPRDQKYFELPKLLFVRLRNKSLNRKLVGTYDEDRYYNRDNFNNIVLREGNHYSLKYILGIFNSNLINYWYKSYFDNVNINPAQIRLIPLRPINFNNPLDKSQHDKIVFYVEKMLNLQHHKVDVVDGNQKDRFVKLIESIDSEVDKLVYELYGLTGEEIRIVEEDSKR